LTKADTDALVAAHPDSHEAVNSWLGYHGVNPEDVTHHSGGGDWVTLRVTVAQAERMLNAKYNLYHHPVSSERVVRTMGYSLPRELHFHVDVVTPTTYFSTLRSMRATYFVQSGSTQVEDISQGQSTSAAVPSSSCNTVITPSCLRTLYNTISYTPAATNVNKLGVAGYLNEYANRADLQVRLGFPIFGLTLNLRLTLHKRRFSDNTGLMLLAPATPLFSSMAVWTIKPTLVQRYVFLCLVVSLAMIEPSFSGQP
jgi:tripeptidyl-peptidase I